MQLTTALLTIVMSGVVAAGVTYFLNANKEQVFFLRKKAEDLFLAAERFDKSLGIHFISAYPLIKGEIGYDEFHDMVIERGKQESGENYEAVLMLTRIYFPDLEQKLNAWMDIRTKLNGILSEHKRAYKADPTTFFNSFHRAVGELNQTSEAFKLAVVNQARLVAGSDALWPRQLTWRYWRPENADRS
jgi:hypothetical protein